MARLSKWPWPDELVGDDWPVYAVLDGARDDGIYDAVVNSGCVYRCLYEGPLPPEMVRVAPYLVALAPHTHLAHALAHEHRGHGWGILLASAANMESVRRHFRKLLRVRDETGRVLLFRFYNPRVMRAYLPTCLPYELEQLFGIVASYWMEADDGHAFVHFALDGTRLRQRQVVMDETAARAPAAPAMAGSLGNPRHPSEVKR